MDDYLDSASTVEEAIARAKDVRDILSKDDFHLMKWASNSEALLEMLVHTPKASVEKALSLGADGLDAKILGLRWKPINDHLMFRVDIGDVIFTRRGLLSKMTKIFDPFGLLAPVIVKAKIKHGELGLQGFQWDEDLPVEQASWWRTWLQGLEKLKELRIPRCLFVDEDIITATELHTMCEASQEAFAAAVYLRNVYVGGSVRVELLMAKTKLAPLKTVSIARLELQAALLGARLCSYVGKAIMRTIEGRKFWADCSCVRNWIRSPAAYYKPYVGHRIGEIQTPTNGREWRYVPGRLNSNDRATRSIMEREPLNHQWSHGPEFLLEEEGGWPRDLPWMMNYEEARPIHEFQSLHMVAKSSEDVVIWDDVDPRDSAGFTKIEGNFVEILKAAQQKSFPKELACLMAGKPLKRKSSLLALTPFVGPEGLLRVGGRLNRAALPYENCHSNIVSGKHPLSAKIVGEYHRRLKHAGTDYVLSAVGQILWIMRGRELVKRIRRICRQCVRESTKPLSQFMPDVPPERMAIVCSPFHHTSVDYFGPLEVWYGRNHIIKWYGSIFTCMTTGAAYLDLAKSLSTDDFLLVMRRLISLYGNPKSFYSDNGRNFVGDERELRECVDRLKDNMNLSKFCESEGVE